MVHYCVAWVRFVQVERGDLAVSSAAVICVCKVYNQLLKTSVANLLTCTMLFETKHQNRLLTMNFSVFSTVYGTSWVTALALCTYCKGN